MPSEYSYVHGQPGYWKVRFDDWDGWEAPHIHAMQGDRELQVYTKTLEIKNQVGRFSYSEIEEIKNIARSYDNNYCLSISESIFETNDIDKLMKLKQLLISMVEPKKMLNNYNLFNNEKVGEVTSTFLEIRNYHTDVVEKFILELINYYELNNLCKNISFHCSNNYYLGMYSEKSKQLYINYKKIFETFNKVSIDNYFIKSNLYRIVLHEIKHILQHKMVNNCNGELYQLFQYEFSNGCNHVFPSEINADIESLLVILNYYDRSHILYDKQLTFSLNIINSFYEPECIVENFCKNNKIQIANVDMMNKFLYGLDNGFIKAKKRFK